MKKWGNAYPIKCLPRWQNRGNFQRMVMGEYKYIPKEEKRNLNVYNKEEGDNMTKKEWEACNTCWVRLKRATYQHIEAEIYAYDDTLKAIEELRTDIILAGRQEAYGAIVGGRYAGTSIVERRATKLADSVLLREMERITRAIQDTFSRAKEEGRRVVWVKYALAIDWQPPAEIQAQMEGRNRFDMSPDHMAEVLAVDRATFHRYRSGFVYGVAERLGWY